MARRILCSNILKCSVNATQSREASIMAHEAIVTRCRFASQTRNMSLGSRPEDPDMSKDLMFDENFEVKPWNHHRSPHPWDLGAISWRMKVRVRTFFGEMPREKISKEEFAEHDALMERLEDCYLEIPQRMPDQQWFLDYIEHCTKYNDYLSAEHTWHWMSSENTVRLPTFYVTQEVIDKFDDFFIQNDPKNWFQMSDHQKERKKTLEKIKLLRDPDTYRRRPTFFVLPDRYTKFTM